MRESSAGGYRWLVVAACTCICFYSMGLTYNMFTMFQTGIEEHTGMTRVQSSAILSIIMGMAAVGSYIAGKVYSRLSIRHFAALFGLAMGLGYAAMIHCGSLALIYAIAVLIGVSYGAGSMAASYTVVNNWFARRNGTVIGIVSMGSGIATFLCPVIINSMIEDLGIVKAMTLHGCVIASLAAVTWLIIRDDPSQKGLRPYGIEDWKPAEKTGPGYDKVKRTGRYYGVLAIGGLCNCIVLPILGQMSAIIREAGYSAVLAATAVSIIGVTMMVSKPLFGAVIDRFGLMRSFALVILVSFASLTCMLLLDRSRVMVFVLAALFGFMVAVTSVGPGAWIQKLFGSRDYQKILGNSLFVVFVSISAFLLITGTLRSSTGSYTIVFLLDTVLAVIMSVIGIMVFRGGSRY